MTANPRSPRSKIISLRLTPDQHATLASTAAQTGLAVAALARLLLDFALARWQQGDPELHRVIRITRGG